MSNPFAIAVHLSTNMFIKIPVFTIVNGDQFLYRNGSKFLWISGINDGPWYCWPMIPMPISHDDVIKWKHFSRYWPFVQGIHRSPVNSPHKGQWRGALIFSLICVWINRWVNNREAGDLGRYRVHYDVIVMVFVFLKNRKTCPHQSTEVSVQAMVRYLFDTMALPDLDHKENI